MIKAVDVDRHMYEERGGRISDRLLKEYKFRAGIAEHDLVRKATG